MVSDTSNSGSDPAPPREGDPRSLPVSLASPFSFGFLVTLGGLLAVLVGIAVANLSTVMIYIVFALFAALGLDPLVRRLERAKLNRAWSIVIVYAVFALLMAGVIWLIVPTVVRQISQFFAALPTVIDDFKESDTFAWLQTTFGEGIDTVAAEFQAFFSDPGNVAAVGGGVLQFGVSIASTVSGLIIVLVLSLYFLASLSSIKDALTRLAASRHRAAVSSMTTQIADSIGGYLSGMVILAFCNSLVALMLHVVLGLPFPALMAVVAFLLTLIPLVGSVLFWAVASLLALFTSPLSALVFAIVYLVYMQLEAYVLTPRVMSRAVSVPGALVVIGALVGGTLLGLLGALVAVPVTASILLIVKQVVIPRQDAKVG